MSHHGRFVWYDLMTADPAAAHDFYGRVLGWGKTAWEMGEGQTYEMFTVSGENVGGAMKLPPEAEAPPHWLAYLSTHDIEASVRRARELGAAIHVPPTDIPTVGRFAVLQDPQGAAFALFQSLPGEEMEPTPAFSWHELVSTDAKAALEFYGALLDWERGDSMDMGEMGFYHMFRPHGGDADFGGAYDMPASMKGVPPHWLHYMVVEDIEDAVRRVRENGGQILNGPMEVPGGDLVAQAADAQGATFGLHQRLAN